MTDAPTAGSEPLLRTLAPALRELGERLGVWLPGSHRIPLSTLQRATFAGLEGDFERQADELQKDRPILVIMLMGGTGVGKSTLLNALAGGAIAQASFARPTTRDPVVYYHQSVQPSRLDPALQHCKLAMHDRPALQQKILVDTPDLDSNDLANRETLLRLLPVADVVLYVGSQEKYHDKLGWDLFLKERRRRAFAFVLNKWDRCQHPGAVGLRPDEDLLRDLKAQGFENPRLFRTCAQFWVDHPWQNSAGPVPEPPVPGEQFLDLARWLESGITRLEIEAIKARGVGQLLKQTEEALAAIAPPDLTSHVDKVRKIWSKAFKEEALAGVEVLLDTLDPYQKEIEHHFALERQGQFHGIMGSYLQLFNKIRYTGSTLRDYIPFLPKMANPVKAQSTWNLQEFTRACGAIASEQHLDARGRALANRLLIEAENSGFPLNLLSAPTEAVAKIDWRARHASAMTEVLQRVERTWTEPTGLRRLLQTIIVFLANWLPLVSLGVMGTILLWGYTINSRPFQWGDLLLPLAVALMVVIVLHVLILLVLPLRWQSIRGEFSAALQTRLAQELEQMYGKVPEEVAQGLLAERRQVEQLLTELREVAAWLQKREQAASVSDLYGSSLGTPIS